MAPPDPLRHTRIPLNNGSGAIPAVGFGTLIPDPLATQQATQTALEVGFRHFDCAERYLRQLGKYEPMAQFPAEWRDEIKARELTAAQR